MWMLQLRMSSRVLSNVMLCCWPSCHDTGLVPWIGNCRCEVHILRPSISPPQVSLSPAASNRSWRILCSFPETEEDTYLSSVFSLPPVTFRVLWRGSLLPWWSFMESDDSDVMPISAARVLRRTIKGAKSQSVDAFRVVFCPIGRGLPLQWRASDLLFMFPRIYLFISCLIQYDLAFCGNCGEWFVQFPSSNWFYVPCCGCRENERNKVP